MCQTMRAEPAFAAFSASLSGIASRSGSDYGYQRTSGITPAKFRFRVESAPSSSMSAFRWITSAFPPEADVYVAPAGLPLLTRRRHSSFEIASASPANYCDVSVNYPERI